MQTLTDYAQAGYEGMQTGAMYSSACWYAEKAGRFLRANYPSIFPVEVKFSRGYSVRINRDYIVKFDKNDNPTLSRK